MRLSVVFALLIVFATLASAYVDFHGMSGAPTRTQLEDGTVQYTHDVHHRFPETNTHFRASYTAKHDAKWHFVELHEHIADMNAHFRCGDTSEQTLHVHTPTEALLGHLSKQQFKHTVVTAHPRHHCGGKAIFRVLEGLEMSSDKSHVTLHTRATSYKEIFRDLSIEMKTNHIHSKLGNHGLPQVSDAKPTRRGMDQQWFWDDSSSSDGFSTSSSSTSWWGKFDNACSRTVDAAGSVASDAANGVADAAHDVASDAGEFTSGWGSDIGDAAGDVKSAADDVASDAAFAGKLAVGDYTKDKVFSLPGCNWNKDVSKSFSQWDIVDEDASLAASFSFTPTVTFKLDIESWDLSNVETYFEGSFNAGVTGKFSATLQKTLTGKKQIADIPITPITFAIGPVPVVLKPSVPINAGYTLNIDGQLAFTAVVSASSTVKYGFGYSPSTGHRSINSADFSYTHDFNPKSFSMTVGLKAYVQPVLTTSIDFIGNVGVGAAIYGDAEVQANDNCAFDLSINAQPTISITAGLDISLDDHSIFSDNWGPYTLWSSKYPLYSYCLPPKQAESDVSSDWARRFQQQAVGAKLSGERDFTQNTQPVITTTITSLGQNDVGRVWSGKGTTCDGASAVVGLQYGVGKTPGSSVYYVTYSATKVPTSSKATYEGVTMGTAQLTYTSPVLPVAGMRMTLTLVNKTGYYYAATTNAAELALNVPETMTLTFNPANIRTAVANSTLFCGGVSVSAPESNNDNSTFFTFAHGGATLQPDATASTSTSGKFNVLIIYAAVVTVVAVIMIALAAYFAGRTSRRTVDDEHKEDGLVMADTANEE